MINTPLPVTLVRGSMPLLAAIALLGAGCAAAPRETPPALQDAQQAITAADRIDAAQHAPGQMMDARSKLAEANTAVTDGKLVVASRLALQSRAAAELASARATAAKAVAENAAIRTGNSAFREELDRNAGDPR